MKGPALKSQGCENVYKQKIIIDNFINNCESLLEIYNYKKCTDT